VHEANVGEGGEAAHPGEDSGLLPALRAGDERAFLRLVGRHHAAMVRLAAAHVGSAAVAEEVAQETWLAVLRGIDGFEGRCSLRSWIFRILVNRARTRGALEHRSVPLSSFDDPETGEPAVDPGRFLDESHPRWPGHWARAPEPWGDERLVARETLERVRQAIDALPPAQRRVILMRDVEGLTSEETCLALELSEGNQRVLLHRARARVRAALEGYLDGTEGNG
jgi:RNA polymerase sigma-70 factor (ECF subfamily)